MAAITKKGARIARRLTEDEACEMLGIDEDDETAGLPLEALASKETLRSFLIEDALTLYAQFLGANEDKLRAAMGL